jgi:hypothetical protein
MAASPSLTAAVTIKETQQQPCKTTIHEEGYHHGVTPNAFIHVNWHFYVLLHRSVLFTFSKWIIHDQLTSLPDIYGATSLKWISLEAGFVQRIVVCCV